MTKIPDFSDSDLWVIRGTLSERYGKEVAIELADAELSLQPTARTLTLCPAVFWPERGCKFVVIKVGDPAYQCQFFYRGRDQFGTGREIYDNLGECVTDFLQVQADHEKEKAGISSGATGEQIK
ncbi:MAG: hypothetical protein ACE5H7_14630 [Acidiferrobacterales bacterium]